MARPGESTTSPRRLLAKQRQAQALALAMAGVGYPEIATKLGYRARNGAFEAVQAAIQANLRANVAGELSMNLQRLDRLLVACWVKAVGLTGPDGKVIIPSDLAASAEARAILAERAKLLGLYPAPGSRRQEHIDEDLLRQEAERAARETGMSVEDVMREALVVLKEGQR